MEAISFGSDILVLHEQVAPNIAYGKFLLVYDANALHGVDGYKYLAKVFFEVRQEATRVKTIYGYSKGISGIAANKVEWGSDNESTILRMVSKATNCYNKYLSQVSMSETNMNALNEYSG